MQEELEKLDLIRSRVRVSYDEARKALNEAGGDVVQALVNLEKREPDLLSVGIEIIDDVQRLLEAPAIKGIRVRFGDRTVAGYPVRFIGTAAVVVGLAAALLSRTSIDIEQQEGASEQEP